MKITRLINKSGADMEIKEFRENKCLNTIPLEVGQQTDINRTTDEWENNTVMIFCDGRSLLRSSEPYYGKEYVWLGKDFYSCKTVTIDRPEDQNSTEVVNYEVKFQPRGRGASDNADKVFSNSFMNHDNGWSVQRCENGIVKLTRKEGMTMTLDPSKLFASNIVPDPETSLLNVVLKFWPRTFADLNCKDDLGTTICIVNDLMRQAKRCHVDESKVEEDEVVQKVRVLSKVEEDEVVQKVRVLKEKCAAMVEWYSPLFPKKVKDQFPPPMAKVDPEKLKKFETTIKDMLRNSRKP